MGKYCAVPHQLFAAFSNSATLLGESFFSDVVPDKIILYLDEDVSLDPTANPSFSFSRKEDWRSEPLHIA